MGGINHLHSQELLTDRAVLSRVYHVVPGEARIPLVIAILDTFDFVNYLK
jgi:glyoxylate utilization-related uncharacterized protein